MFESLHSDQRNSKTYDPTFVSLREILLRDEWLAAQLVVFLCFSSVLTTIFEDYT